MNGTTKIIIAEDHCVLREGLRSLLQKQAHIEVVGEADNGRQAIQLAGELNPDVAVMGISMPELNGIDAARRIVDQYCGVKVIMLSMYHDRKLVIAALKAGASGYVLKNCSVEELINAINAAVRGHIYLYSRF
jgi:two-component system response regulator NreC